MSITIKSNDGKVYKIKEEACNMSKFLKNQIRAGKKEIELEDIKGEIVALIINYLNS